MIFINDGSTDGSHDILDHLAEEDQRVRIIHFRKNFGQAAATMAGFDYARGEVIIPLDGDGQNDPADIPKMLELSENGGGPRLRHPLRILQWHTIRDHSFIFLCG